MEVEYLVDAGLVGLDRKELLTGPPRPMWRRGILQSAGKAALNGILRLVFSIFADFVFDFLS